MFTEKESRMPATTCTGAEMKMFPARSSSASLLFELGIGTIGSQDVSAEIAVEKST